MVIFVVRNSTEINRGVNLRRVVKGDIVDSLSKRIA